MTASTPAFEMNRLREEDPMLPFMSFLIALMVALGVIGATMSGRYPLTVVAAVTLLLTLAVGAWTMTRRHKV